MLQSVQGDALPRFLVRAPVRASWVSNMPDILQMQLCQRVHGGRPGTARDVDTAMRILLLPFISAYNLFTYLSAYPPGGSFGHLSSGFWLAVAGMWRRTDDGS